jgi:hypothetical protein
MWAATLQRLVDVGGVIEVPVAAESARSEGTVRVGVRPGGGKSRVARAGTTREAGRGTARHPEGLGGAKNATRLRAGRMGARRWPAWSTRVRAARCMRRSPR